MDVTSDILRFRECVKSVWNDHLRTIVRSEYSSHEIFRFRQVEALLFQTMICDRFGQAGRALDRVSDYSAPLLAKTAADARVPLLIQRAPETSGYWDHSVSSTGGHPVQGRFLGFFDWDELGVINCQFARIKIESFAMHPDVIGHEALIDVQFVSFEYLSEPAAHVAPAAPSRD